MMSNEADNNRYSAWNRMRRIHAPSYVARVDTPTSRNAAAMHSGTDANANGNPGDVVINMNDIGANAIGKDCKDTLFGPSIGVVGTAPEWCAEDAELDEKEHEKTRGMNEKDANGVDELTPEVVKEWVKRSKENSEPTTTLQALVNLKRPSIRLSPLAVPSHSVSASASTDEVKETHHQQHGLEFEFDCDAPQCAISLHVVGVPSDLADEHTQSQTKLPGEANASTNERLVLFETNLSGGFARKLTLAEGAVLELARIESAAKAHREQLAAAAAAKESTTNGGNGNTATGSGNAAAPTQTRNHPKKRLTLFRKKGGSHTHTQTQASTPVPAVPAGPALAVVDAEASPHPHHQEPASSTSTSPPPLTSSPSQQSQTPAQGRAGDALTTFFAGGEAERARRKKALEEEGVRIAICLKARDGEGRPLRVRNEQVTYLHVVRQGPPQHSVVPVPIPAAATTSAEAAVAEEQDEGEQQTEGTGEEANETEKEDTRPWVVRVVKREARIGAHSFQLHEIYGLTAHASASEAAHAVTPSSPTSFPNPSSPSADHTYPPQSQPPILNTTAAAGAGAETEDSPAECLLCLSSAREVVLLPCRHLVACRECAVNMVEFGAGGTVTQPAEAEPATNGEGAGGDGAADANANGETVVATPAAVTAPTAATRRKRKAKGWFCPVCRQPYTSLLRITTAPPPSKGAGTGHGHIGAETGDAKRVSLASSLEPEGTPSPVDEAQPQQQQQETAEVAHPLANTATPAPETASINRPGFLRHISGRTNASGATTPRD